MERESPGRRWLKPEHVLVGVLLLVGVLAVPAAANVYLVQSMFVSFCSALGLPVR